VLPIILNVLYAITKRNFVKPWYILVFIYLIKMLHESWNLMLSKNFSISIIAVMHIVVSAHRVVPM
jgi:hypothetical protein